MTHETRVIGASGAPGAGEGDPIGPASPSRLGWSALALWVPLGLGVAFTFGHSVDDAFITLRFARNLIEGHGLAFNPGQRVEGYSSPLHLAVGLASNVGAGGHALFASKLASLTFLALTAWRAQGVVASLPVARSARLVALLLIGSSYPLAIAGGNGLETSLYALLLVVLIDAHARGAAEDRPWSLGVVAALVVLVRPEGVAVIVTVAMVTALRRPVGSSTRSFRWILVPGGVVVLATLARLAYFGAIVPNTYFAKSVPFGPAVRSGVGYLAWSVVPESAYIPRSLAGVIGDLLLLWVGAVVVVGGIVALRSRCWFGCVAVVGAQVAFVLLSGGDWMRGSRFVAPIVVPTVVLVAFGLDGLMRWGSSRSPQLGRSLGAVGAVLLIGASAVSWVRLPTFPVWELSGVDDRALVVDGGYGGSWGAIPDLLACARPGDAVATTEIGFVGWSRPDLEIMDLSGLTDRTIATGAPTASRWIIGVGEPDWNDDEAFVVQEVVRRSPELVIVSAVPEPGSAVGRRYRAEGVVEVDGWTLTALVRRDRAC